MATVIKTSMIYALLFVQTFPTHSILIPTTPVNCRAGTVVYLFADHHYRVRRLHNNQCNTFLLLPLRPLVDVYGHAVTSTISYDLLTVFSAICKNPPCASAVLIYVHFGPPLPFTYRRPGQCYTCVVISISPK